jgi:hypothetical protein
MAFVGCRLRAGGGFFLVKLLPIVNIIRGCIALLDSFFLETHIHGDDDDGLG